MWYAIGSDVDMCTVALAGQQHLVWTADVELYQILLDALAGLKKLFHIIDHIVHGRVQDVIRVLVNKFSGDVSMIRIEAHAIPVRATWSF